MIAELGWHEAQLGFARLARPLGELLRERDEAAGIWRDPSYYAAAVRMPPFPLRTAELAVSCRPRAADLLSEPPQRNPKSASMTRVA